MDGNEEVSVSAVIGSLQSQVAHYALETAKKDGLIERLSKENSDLRVMLDELAKESPCQEEVDH